MLFLRMCRTDISIFFKEILKDPNVNVIMEPIKL